MSGRNSLKVPNKSDYSSDTLDSRIRKENFNRLRSIFEIKRPYKSRNPTLRKSKSTSALSSSPSQSSDDERETSKEKVIVRTSLYHSSIRNANKYKKRSLVSNPKTNYLKELGNKMNVPENSDKANTLELDTKLKNSSQKNEKSSSCTVNCIFHRSTEPRYESDNDVFSDSEEVQCERKYIKHKLKSQKNYVSESTTGRISETSKDLALWKQNGNDQKGVENFIEADCEGETETYRKNLVNEMDREVAKMKLDGFLDEDENLDNSNTEQDINQNIVENELETNKEKESRKPNIVKRNGSKYNRYKQLFEGVFNELDRNMELIEHESNITLQSVGKEFKNDDNENQFPIDHKEVSPIIDTKVQFEQRGKPMLPTEQENEYEIEEKPTINETTALNQDHSSNEESSISLKHSEELHRYKEKWRIKSKESKTLSKTKRIDQSLNSERNTTSPHKVSFEDEFSESLGDDLENGSYFVEAYNDEGRELVIVEISLERRTVNLNKPFPLENIKKSINDADMVFQQRDDKTLNLIENPQEFVHENTAIISSGFSNGADSNRSTVYSTTSRESDAFDEDDEGISMGNVEQRTCIDDDEYNNVRRETFCDHKGIVRIERVGYPESVHNPSLEDLQPSVSRNNSFTQKGKLSYIIEEIKSTEKKYVADLNKVVKKYIPYVERHTPPNLLGRQYYIFGNIQTLFENQKKFLAALEDCGEEAEDVVRKFIDFKDLFKLYPTYFKNKPKADVVLREFNLVIKQAQDRFKERLDLSAYLLTPLQRLGKYKLFLENIEKQLRKLELPTENATTALEMIKKEMSKGNDFVAIESIQRSPLLKTDYGSFKMREIFTVIKPKRFESMVFLFENVVVFTALGNQRNMEIYTYHDSIKMNDLRIATFEDTTIHLTDFTKGKKLSRADRFTYILDAKTEKVKDTWRKAVEDILWQQLYKVKENTIKMYQVKPSKRGKISRGRIKSAGSSVFYVSDF